MSRIAVAAALALLLLAGLVRGADAADGFLGGLEDVPLAPGLVEEAGRTVIFDKPGGRIVEAFARGAVAQGDAMAFYAAALPELGWLPDRAGAAASRLAFRREAEGLVIDFMRLPAGLEVRFSVSPAQGGPAARGKDGE